MAKPPKLANIETVSDFTHWLADTIQQAVSKENAGFVQIERGGDTSAGDIAITSSRARFFMRVVGGEE